MIISPPYKILQIMHVTYVYLAKYYISKISLSTYGIFYKAGKFLGDYSL